MMTFSAPSNIRVPVIITDAIKFVQQKKEELSKVNTVQDTHKAF